MNIARKILAWLEILYCSVNAIMASLLFTVIFTLAGYDERLMMGLIAFLVILPNMLTIGAAVALLRAQPYGMGGHRFMAWYWLLLILLAIGYLLMLGHKHGEFMTFVVFYTLSFLIPCILTITIRTVSR